MTVRRCVALLLQHALAAELRNTDAVAKTQHYAVLQELRAITPWLKPKLKQVYLHILCDKHGAIAAVTNTAKERY